MDDGRECRAVTFAAFVDADGACDARFQSESGCAWNDEIARWNA